MNQDWLNHSDVAITVEDHPTKKNKFLVHIHKDRYGSMASTPVYELPEELVVPLIKSAASNGHVEQETVNRSNFYFVNESTVVVRNTKMDKLDFLYWIVQQFGPIPEAAWAKQKRAALPIARPLSIEKQRLKDGLCPKCGSEGYMHRTALMCRTHGWYAGI